MRINSLSYPTDRGGVITVFDARQRGLISIGLADGGQKVDQAISILNFIQGARAGNYQIETVIEVLEAVYLSSRQSTSD